MYFVLGLLFVCFQWGDRGGRHKETEYLIFIALDPKICFVI